jgi:uncharacterized protein
MLRSKFCTFVLLIVSTATGTFGTHPVHAASVREAMTLVNRGVVEMETGPADDVSVRIAAEIAGIVDDGSTRRVVPVVGKGSLQNLMDLKYLRGIDLAIVQSDVLDYAREQQLVPGLDSVSYIVKLYNEEFHLLARPDIKSIEQLAGQTVNIGAKDSGSAVTATRLFGLLGIKVKPANDDPGVALRQLRRSEIAAIAFVAAKPAPFFLDLKPGDRLHLLSVPLSSQVTAAYAPTQITAADYPTLVMPDAPADTVAVGNVLVAADLHGIPERWRNLSNFVDTFFTGFQGLLAEGHDPRWQEVNIAADVPGWRRHPAAADWLQSNAQVAAAPNADLLKTLFARFVDEHRQASGGTPMSAAEKDALFQQFRNWQREQPR